MRVRWREGGMELGDGRVSRGLSPLSCCVWEGPDDSGPQMLPLPPREGYAGCVNRPKRPTRGLQNP